MISQNQAHLRQEGIVHLLGGAGYHCESESSGAADRECGPEGAIDTRG